jgi:hypothetical protein
MSTRAEKFNKFQRDVLKNLEDTNDKLDKICSLLVSNQLLLECVSPEGQVRTANECAEIVSESFCAGMCLNEELNSRSKEFSYQKSEFFVDEDEESAQSDDDDDDDNPQEFISRHPAMKF